MKVVLHTTYDAFAATLSEHTPPHALLEVCRDISHLERALSEAPDVAILDVRTPSVSTVIDVARLAHLHARTKILVVRRRGGLLRRASFLEGGALDVFDLEEEESDSCMVRSAKAVWRTVAVRMNQFSAPALSLAQLEGINVLARELARATDTHDIVSKTLSTLVKMCTHGAAAYLRADEIESDDRGLVDLFSESEVEDIQYAISEAKEEAPERIFDLSVVDQQSEDHLLVSLDPAPHPSWETLFARRETIMLMERPRFGDFPGLEPLWRRLTDNVVFLIPIHGKRIGPLGVLVMAELDLVTAGRMPMSREGMSEVALLVASALENVALFERSAHSLETLKEAQDQLVSTEKFAAVGHLSAQIVHEINNPASFVISNLSVMQEYVSTISSFINAIHDEEGTMRIERFDHLLEEHELAFLREDLEALITRSLSGMQRIHQIVQDLRYLAHDSGPELSWTDLEALLDASLNLIHHDIKHRATIIREYAHVPHVLSDANKLSQVFLNLLVNASQSLGAGDMDEDWLKVGTASWGEGVLVFIEDSGVGMSKALVSRIFDPFFTTKRRGEGTGLGLSMVRDIIRALDGDIRVTSMPGVGSRFEIVLPIRPPSALGRQERAGWRHPPSSSGTEEHDQSSPRAKSYEAMSGDEARGE